METQKGARMSSCLGLPVSKQSSVFLKCLLYCRIFLFHFFLGSQLESHSLDGLSVRQPAPEIERTGSAARNLLSITRPTAHLLSTEIKNFLTSQWAHLSLSISCGHNKNTGDG